MTLADPVMVTRSVAEARAAGRDSIRLKPPAPHTSTPTQRARTPALAQGTPHCPPKGIGGTHAAVPGARVMASPTTRVGERKSVGFHPKTGGCHHGAHAGTAGWAAGGWAPGAATCHMSRCHPGHVGGDDTRVPSAMRAPGQGDCGTSGRATEGAACWGPRPCPQGRYPPGK